MMRASTTLISFLATAVPICQAASSSYWIDKSCTDRPLWEPAFREFWTMGKRGGERLASSTDTDYGAVFKRIFRVEKTDNTQLNPPNSGPKTTAYNIVQGKLIIYFLAIVEVENKSSKL